jgi:regulator of sigma E protease
MSVVLLLAALALLTLVHEFGHALVALALGMHVTAVSAGLGPPVVRTRWHATELLLCVVPFGGFVRVAELEDAELGARQPRVTLWKRLAVAFAGSASNYIVAATLATALALGWGVDTGRVEGLEVTMVSDYASEVGLRVGDIIARADGASVQSVDQLQASFAAAETRPLRVEMQRDGTAVTVSLVPAAFGQHGVGARYVPRPELVRMGMLGSVGWGLVDPFRRAQRLLVNSTAMLSRRQGARPATPVGLAARVAQSGRWDARRVVSFGCLLSVMVGLFNLLPVPGLDGGRVCIALGEGVVRRKLQPRVATAMQVAGALALFGTWVVLAFLDALALGR